MKLKKEDQPTRIKLLKTALSLYLKHGYSSTTNQMIVKKINCSPGEITHFFGTKENMLYEIVKIILPTHQETLEGKENSDILSELKYSIEIAVEIAMCENNEIIRDLYINAYTLPKVIGLIRDYSYKKTYNLFSSKLPSWDEQDFFENEIFSMGIVYASLMEKCTPRYNLKQKIARTINALLKMYEFDVITRSEIVVNVTKLDLVKLASDAEKEMRQQIENYLNNC